MVECDFGVVVMDGGVFYWGGGYNRSEFVHTGMVSSDGE